MNRDVLDSWCERGILVLLLAILIFAPLATGAVLDTQFLVVEGLTFAIALLWAARFWLKPKSRLFWPPVCWAVLAFAAYAVIRYLTSDIEYVARQELLRVLVYAVLFLAVVNNLQRQETPQIVTFALLFLAMAISFYALYQFIGGSNKVWWFQSLYPKRGSGTYICPDHLAGFLEQLLPLGLAYTLAGRVKPVTRILIGYASLVIAAGIAVTLSRGGWISTGVSLIAFFGVLVLNRTHRLPSILLLVVLVGGGFYFIQKDIAFKVRARLLASGNGKIGDDYRFVLWQPALRIWQDHLLWGAGPAHFDYRFRAYRPQEVQVRPDRVHNDILNTLADWGIAGAALVASAWFLVAIGAVKTWRRLGGKSDDVGAKRTSNKFAFVLGASLGLLAILCHSVVDFNMHVPANAILAVTLMALLTSHLRYATDRYWTTAGLMLKTLCTALLLITSACLAQQGIRQARATLWLARADQAEPNSTAQINALKKAFAAESKNHETAYALGEIFRSLSQLGNFDYRDLATNAIQWYDTTIALDPYYDSAYLGHGWCLDWLGRPADAAPYFDRALRLDPNGYYTAASLGLHYMQLEDYAAAKPCFERSLRLSWVDNPIAHTYFDLAQSRLLEAATNDIASRLADPHP